MESIDGGNSDLEIKVVSAKHLWAFNFFQKLCVYAAASLSADDPRRLSKDQMQEQRTATDPDGDGHPEWNHPMTFRLSDLPNLADVYLRFDLRHHAGILFPDRTIGEVKVPLSDLLESSDSFRFVDYQIRSPDGKPNGVLHFGYKLNRIGSHTPVSPVSISGYPQISDQMEKPPSLYPAADMWEPTPAPVASQIPTDEARPAVYQANFPADSSEQQPFQYPTHPPPMWAPPPPPPPPYWPPPPGFMHPPPPPPPGYFHYPWRYQQQAEGQYNNGR